MPVAEELPESGAVVEAGGGVGVDADAPPSSDSIFCRVMRPALPSAVSPLAFWKAVTAFCVPAPNLPSALPAL